MLHQMHKVVIVSETLHPYRLPFYRNLAETLRTSQFPTQMELVHGNCKYRQIDCPGFVNSYAPVFRIGRITLQILPRSFYSAHLAIFGQEVRHLNQYLPYLAHLLFKRQKFCLWGHGKNFQSKNTMSPQEMWKAHITRHAHWFFAYNDLSASIVAGHGFPADRITNMMNSIDTASLVVSKQQLDPNDLISLRQSLGINGQHVGIYTGSMYREKRIPFLLQSCYKIRQSVSDFEMIFIGDGEDHSLVSEAARQNSWIHYVGVKNESEKVPYWAISQVFLMPGAVGLVILDSFALETPMVTTAVSTHGPEIDYLEDGVNGVMVKDPFSIAAFTDTVIDLLINEPKRRHLAAGCRASVSKYSIENSAKLFSSGINAALAAPHYRGVTNSDSRSI
jgi:glycosyltransferase involved in cell wall biosynthesis